MSHNPLEFFDKLTDNDFDKLAELSFRPLEKPFPDIGDFHSTNAIAFYGREKMEQAYKQDPKRYKEFYRANAKGVGLGLLYGGSYQVVQRGLNVSEAEAKQLHSNFFTMLQGFKTHLKTEMAVAKKHKKVRNLFGSVIYLNGINSDDWQERSANERRLYNYPIQSVSADLIKLIMVRTSEFIERNRLNTIEGQLINHSYYDKVVGLEKSLLTPQMIDELDKLPNGNTLFVLTDNNQIVEKFDRHLLINDDFIFSYGLSLLFG